MRALAASIEDVFREAAARWTLIAYFVLSTIFVLIFAAAVNLDIVNGALAGAKLFGQSVHMSGNSVDVDQLVLGFETGFAAILYAVGIFLAIFATAHLVPRLQDKGTIDLYLSRPVGRTQLLISRYVAGLLLAATNVIYLLGAVWLIVIWKTHVVHPQFLLSVVLILFVVAVLLAFTFLIGVVTSSTAVSIMSTFSILLISSVLAAHDKFEAAIATQWRATLVHLMYVVFPKTPEIGKDVFALVSGGEGPFSRLQPFSWSPFVSTALFGAVCLFLASWLFSRKEF
ncbi:MAG: ABC transporter permease subunit [Thermoanaerobaculia bacterium]